MVSHESTTEELSSSACWPLLRTGEIGRLAVWVDGHPDIFPINYAVDHGTIVFRTRTGTKSSGALSEASVALEIDGQDPDSSAAWSVVLRGRAEHVHRDDELLELAELPLAPWEGGDKPIFVRIVPDIVTGRRFAVVDPGVWHTPLSGARKASAE